MIRTTKTGVISLAALLCLPLAGTYGGDLTIQGDLIVASNLTVQGTLAVASNRVTSIADAATDTDAVNYRTMTNYVETASGTGNMNADGSIPMTGDLDLGTNRITNVANAIDDHDAVSRSYLTNLLANIQPMGGLSMGVYTNKPQE